MHACMYVLNVKIGATTLGVTSCQNPKNQPSEHVVGNFAYVDGKMP